MQREVGERLSEASENRQMPEADRGEIKELDRKMVMKAVGNHIESIRERFGAMEKSLFISMSFWMISLPTWGI